MEITRIKIVNGEQLPVDFIELKDGRTVYITAEGFNNEFYVTDVKTKEKIWITEEDVKI